MLDQMLSINYPTIPGLLLGIRVFTLTDKLSTTLQSAKMTVADAQSLASKYIRTLEGLRSDEDFEMLWKETSQYQEKLGLFLCFRPDCIEYNKVRM